MYGGGLELLSNLDVSCSLADSDDSMSCSLADDSDAVDSDAGLSPCNIDLSPWIMMMMSCKIDPSPSMMMMIMSYTAWFSVPNMPTP